MFLFCSSPTFFADNTATTPPNTVGRVPTLSIILSRIFKMFVPPSTTNLIKSLSTIVCDNDSNEALKVSICQFIN